jgi:hypothetical protein
MGDNRDMTPDVDSVLAAAVDVARAAALEAADSDVVGAHVEVVADGDFVATHYFENTSVAYRGWRWAVTLVRVPDSDIITIDEVVLLPGVDSLLAPAWVPWNDRVRPGDLSPGDLLPTDPEDPRLEPGFTGTDALDEIDDLTTALGPLRPEQWQLGLGRERVLSAWGRDDAADRWDAGDFGPDAPMAKAAPGSCQSCGFVIRIGGSLGQAFGLCANAFGADGRVVSLRYGCGAHSSVRPIEGTGIPVTEMAVDEILADELTLDPIDLDASVDEVAVSESIAELDEDLLEDGLGGQQDEDIEDVDLDDEDIEDIDDGDDEDDEDDDEDDDDDVVSLEDDEEDDELDEDDEDDDEDDVQDVEPDGFFA